MKVFRWLLIAWALCATLSSASAQALTPASCASGVTPAQTEGPYFKPGSPERSSLLSQGASGARITLTGWVVTKNCVPVAGAVLDFWQADDAGRYDNAGYTLRGHVKTDAQGKFTVETVVPGIYPWRTRHIHVKVQAPGKPGLTTQLYFPEDAQQNTSDGIYDARLLVRWLDAPARKIARYDFVLDIS